MNPLGVPWDRSSWVDGLAYLQEIDVLPDHGRRGIGTSLIHAVCEWAQFKKVAAVTLTTFRHLPWNAPFYERLGFRSLTQDELTSGLDAILADEAENGLDKTKRVAMLKQLRKASKRVSQSPDKIEPEKSGQRKPTP